MQPAIAELGYVPNLAARSLAGRRADAVALASSEKDWRKFGEPFFSEAARGRPSGTPCKHEHACFSELHQLGQGLIGT